jgi:hypothetical protein
MTESSPTNRFGLMPQQPHDSDPPPELAAAAARMDAYIAVFALGVILGWLLRTGGAA